MGILIYYIFIYVSDLYYYLFFCFDRFLIFNT